MWITFKTLEQKTFKIEIATTEKVKALKEKIAEERGGEQFPVAGQKLIYSGKILDDEKVISECGIDDKNFIVVMVVKKKTERPKEAVEPAAPSADACVSAESASSSASIESAEPSTACASEPSSETTTATSTECCTEESSMPTPQNTTDLAESALLTGSALESSTTELMNLGYTRDQVTRALDRSFHNADRAAEYLLSGNIPDLPDESEVVEPPAVSNTTTPSVTAGDLSFLRNLPQFQSMRARVQQNPESLPQLLQQIGHSNPELLSVISQHQEAFITLLNEHEPVSSPDSGAGGGSGPLQIQVTPTEKEAIDGMVAMGFPEGEVIQAFFACDKNEQLAIEFLLKE